MKHLLIKALNLFSVLLLIFSLCVGLFCVAVPNQASAAWDGTLAASFSSGSGTEASPYKIASETQLGYFFSQLSAGVTYEGKYIQLTKNLDMTGGSWKTAGTAFLGNFHGMGHTVTADQPFLSTIGESGTVQSLNYMVTTKQSDNVFCDTNKGTLLGCVVMGDASSDTTKTTYVHTLGLLCGSNYGTIQACGGVGTVYAKGDDSDAKAGLVAVNYGIMENCYSAVSPSASAPGKYNYDYAHPLAAHNQGTVTDCVYDETVYTTSTNIGLGLTTAEMKSNIALGYISSSDLSNSRWSMTNGFGGYPSMIPASSYKSYVTGYQGEDLIVYNAASTSVTLSKTGSYGTICYSLDENETDPAKFKTYTAGTKINISGDAVLSSSVYDNGSYGVVTRQRFFSLPGSGTATDPYRIGTPRQLTALSMYPSAHFVLTNDITFTDSDYAINGACPKQWTPVSGFSGTLDGKTHAISGLYSRLGGLVDSNRGTIKNLRMINHRLQGPDDSGAIANTNSGTVTRCYTKSAYTLSTLPTVLGPDIGQHIGGVVGYNSGTVSYCRNDGVVAACSTTREAHVWLGGIVGQGSADNCINTGLLAFDNITSVNYPYIGGIAGCGSVRNCLSLGDMYLDVACSYETYAAGLSAFHSSGYTYYSIASDFEITKAPTMYSQVVRSAFCGIHVSPIACYMLENVHLPQDAPELDFISNWMISGNGAVPQGVMDENGHAYRLAATQILPTCEAKGDQRLVCDLCGDTKVITLQALGHSFTDYTSDNNATCLADGTKTAKCDRCDVTDSQPDTGSALGHSFVNYVSNGDATCTADGTKTAKCDRCDITDTQPDTGSALGHSFVNYVSNGDAACTADGTKTAKCDRCDVTDTQPDIGTALGHDNGYALTDSTIAESCSQCDHSASASVAVTDDGSTVTVTVQDYAESWLGTREPSVAYVGRGETQYGPAVQAPNAVGAYTAEIIFAEGKPVSVDFEVPGFTVTFQPNGGTGTVPADQVLRPNAPIAVPSGAGLTKKYHKFIGWNSETDGTGESLTESALATKDVTYYAQWQKNHCHSDEISGGECEFDILLNMDVVQSMGYTLSSGRYCLEEELALDETLNIRGKVSLCLNGYNISSNTYENNVITVQNYASLSLYDCELVPGQVRDGDSGICAYGTLTLYDASVTANSGYGVYVGSDFTMNGGSVTGNSGYAISGSGKVTLNDGIVEGDVGAFGDYVLEGGSVTGTIHTYSFTMNGGTVTGGLSLLSGSATMTGGTISSYPFGGTYMPAVSINSGTTFTMEDGLITGDALGVHSSSNSRFIMKGGKISGLPKAAIEARGHVTISGGEISGNGVASRSIDEKFCYGSIFVDGTLQISGNPVIWDNTNAHGEQANIFLPKGKIVTIPKAGLTEGAKIGITPQIVPGAEESVAISGLNTVDYSAFFVPDRVPYQIRYADNMLVMELKTFHRHSSDICGGAVDFLLPLTLDTLEKCNYNLEEGHYYLTEALSLEQSIGTDGEVLICLNGFDMISSAEAVFHGSNVSVYDCSKKPGAITGAKYGAYGANITMYGGNITGNSDCGVANSDLTMYGGTISNNGKYGVNSSGAMYGGTITGNGYHGVGVPSHGHFVLNGGAITGNDKTAYGVELKSYGTFTIAGGTISGHNTGVYINSYSNFNAFGGTITGNMVGVTGSNNHVTLQASGSPVITGNYDHLGRASNMHLFPSDTITVTEPGLNEDAAIGITLDYDILGTSAAITGSNSADYSRCFIPDFSLHTTENREGVVYMIWNGDHSHGADICGGECHFNIPVTQDMVDRYIYGGNDYRMPAGHYYLAEDITLNYGFNMMGDVKLCLNGHTISGTFQKGTYANTLYLYDCQETPGSVTSVSANSNSTVIMYGGHAKSISSYGSFTMEGGSCNHAYVYNDSTLTMNGGTIADYHAVAVEIAGNFIMNGGTITRNAGVYNGSKYYSRTVNVTGTGNFIMNEGTITGNDGSAVDYDSTTVWVEGNFTMNGGFITDNLGIGVNISTNGSVTFSGSPVITGNVRARDGQAYEAANLLLQRGQTVTIGEGGLREGAQIGVATNVAPTAAAPVAVTGTNNADYSSFFFSDADDYIIADENHAVILRVPHVHTWVDATCTQPRTCSGCGETEGTANGHTWQDATCTAAQTCSVCQVTSGEPLGHDIVTVEAQVPACTGIGWAAYETCSRCDYTTYQEIEATGHNLETVEAQAPTCTEIGWDGYATCKNDGCAYTTYEEIPALGHELVSHAAQEATCVATGSSEYWSCSECGQFFSDAAGKTSIEKGSWITEKDSTNHDYADDLTQDEDTHYHICTRCGSRKDEMPHSYGGWASNQDGTHAQTCICGHTVTRNCFGTDDHNCTTALVCADCGDVMIPAKDHNFTADSGQKVFDATCEENQINYAKCADCGMVSNERVVEIIDSKLGHVFETVEAKAPGCTEAGWKEYVICKRDGCEYTTYEEIKATGHRHEAVVTAPTCTEQGYTTHTCHCGDSYKDTYVKATGHHFADYVSQQDATCTTDGTKIATCENCSVTDTKPDVGSRLGHDMGEWVTITEPGCVTKGTQQSDCTRCEYFETQPVAAVGHRHEAVVTAPTCTEQGYTTHTCHCGDSYKDSYVSASGHSLEKHDEQAPTCVAPGWEAYKSCKNCDYTTYKEIEATGHSMESHDAKEPTCTEFGWAAYEACRNCDHTTYEKIDALGHDEVHHAAKEPSYTEIGWNAYVTCVRCDYSTYQEIPVLIPNPETPVVKATSDTASGQVKLTWKAVENAEQYRLYRATSKNGQYTFLNSVSDISFVDDTARVGTTYYYYVVAEGPGGESGRSSIVYRTCDLPRPVLELSNSASTGKIKLNWQDIEDAVEYKIYRATSKSGKYSLIKTTQKSSFTDSDTSAGKTYYYKVKAVHEKSAANSAYSEVGYRTCDLKRTSITLSSVSTSGKIKVKWKSVSGAEEYAVYRSATEDGEYGKIKTTSSTSYTDKSAKAGTTYYYKVVAVHKNSAGNSAYSEAVSRTCDLAKPEIKLSSISDSGQIRIRWEEIEDTQVYKIYRAASKTGKYSDIGETSDSEFIDHDTTAGKKYYYKVRAIHEKSAANSAYSDVESRTCDLPRPEVTIVLSKGNPKLSWEKISGAEEYTVYRATSKSGEYKKIKTTSSTSCKDKDVKEGKTYYYKVKAIHENSSANSAYSSVQSIKAE